MNEKTVRFSGPYAPEYSSKGAAGADLKAWFQNHLESIEILPGEIAVIPTAVYVALPEGTELQIRSRSGLSVKGLVVANSPGTIDCDYRGEIKVIMMNHSDTPFTIFDGDRIAQAVLAPYYRAVFVEDKINEDETQRGVAGFGSTGV